MAEVLACGPIVLSSSTVFHIALAKHGLQLCVQSKAGNSKKYLHSSRVRSKRTLI